MDADGKILKRRKERFGGDEGDDEDFVEEEKTKKARFPKGKKAPEEKLDADEEDGPIIAADARAVATKRAVSRKEKGKNKLREDTEVGGNVGGAEQEYEDYDDEQGLIRDEEGTKLEPFNLKKEREDGYFDAEGNYVEYRQENDARDAWLEGVKVDPSLAQRAAEEQAAADTVDEEMSTAEMASIKRRIADSLEEGETVLQGLRRLGGASKGPGRAKQAGQGRGRGSSMAGEAKMSEEQKQRFDMLTEDASRLMEAGEYNVYSDKKETFLREAEGYEAIHRLRAQAAATAEDDDMFADEDAPATSKRDRGEPSTNGAGPSAGVPAEDSGFVYDEASGYYYNDQQGYYFDPGSGLYCNASTQQWYYLNPETKVYEEVKSEDGQQAKRARAS